MTTGSESKSRALRITVEKNGPYTVQGGVPLVRKAQVVSEHGEPLTWHKEEEIEVEETYWLCRCGQSANRPFCDSTHRVKGFDGTETADTRTFAERRVVLEGGTRIVVKRDYSLCMEAGFCGNRLGNIEQMMAQTGDSTVRAQVIAMIERCPSGSYSYAIEEGTEDVEPDLPRQVAVTVEMTSNGPVGGPLWVTGNIPVERSDGQAMETRNRVVLCGCGLSRTKPLCDGTHRGEGVKPA